MYGCRFWFRILPVLSAVVSLFVLAGAGCRRQTEVFGELVLEPGHVGDIRGSRVELHALLDLSGEPVVVVLSDQARDQRRSEFRMVGVPAGTYYLLAWRDADGDGRISDRDIVGVHGDTYRPGYGGEPLEFFDGSVVDAGTIEMRTWRDPVRELDGLRVSTLDTTEFRMVFNYDLELDAMAVQFPGLGTLLDPDAPGPKVAGAVYVSGGWTRGGAEMPSGRHLVTLVGRLEDEEFSVTLPVMVD